ncbi:hypothetical protein CAPTEDRAFT_221383 [Capitella teleta]|uniref:LRRCT domain-containing protein n=1 Tax=Capitella teleta TaxID=283909 RepID=R7UQT1_CAPTE|nr:hypothetical protein CAPTEDRAFT_221383 [Capitella teleta]|eukprot:ELU05776.1 hypothetical protein CAPTEDRAFT_221383 [Capitella teleta]
MGYFNFLQRPTWLLLLVLPFNVLPAPSLGQETPSQFYDGRHNDISFVPTDIPSNTQILYLSYNNLTSIGARAFSKLQALSTVDLAFNSINFISPKSFLETRVSSLDLCWNQLKNFPDLRTLHLSLTFLDLCRNKLTQVPVSVLQGLRLKSIDLSNNEISEFPDFSLLADTLTVIDLSYNPIAKIRPELLTPLVNLERLYLENALLAVVPDFSLMPFPNAMKELHLSRNHIKTFPPRVFKTLSLLTELFLAHNQIESVAESSLTGLTSLDSLDLSHNRMSHLPDIRSVKRSLTFLDLSHNDFSRLAENDIPGLVSLMAKLDYLVVKDAHLRTIGDIRSLVHPESDLHLDMSGNNDLVCDCSLAWIKNSNIAKDLKPDSRPCGQPQKFRGVRWDSISAASLCEGQPIPEPKRPEIKHFTETKVESLVEAVNEDTGIPQPMRETDDHWNTVHVAPIIITKDVDWSFLTDHVTLVCVVAFGTFLWLSIAIYVCVSTQKKKRKTAKEISKSPTMMVSEPGALTFVYRQQETNSGALKSIPADT